MIRWFCIALATLSIAAIAGTAHVVTAEQAPRPRVTSIAVDPANALALEGVEITFESEESGASVSCITDERGGCTIERAFPIGRLIVYATAAGARGMSRRIALPRSGEVLVYVPVPPRR